MPAVSPTDIPLAQRMRPKTLDAVIGQRHLLSKGAPLRRLVEHGHLPSIILHGEAGVGKTTIAMLLADAVNRPFHSLSALTTGVKQLREVLESKDTLSLSAPVVFIDEIHRFNKGQQDALLGAVEAGDITLIGATTENPSFSINNALLSRCQTYRLEPLTHGQIAKLLERATLEDNILKTLDINLKASDTIADLAHGDARKALNILEIAVQTADRSKGTLTIDDPLVSSVAQSALIKYDKDGEQHYNIVSAMIKSIRGSDPDAALYWMARMLVAGEPADFIARRLVIAASEDIGNANPNALLLADAALRSVQSIGMPEARIILGQVVVYLATSAKSNSTYKAINAAMALAEKDASPVPMHLRNGTTKLMRQQGYGQGYIYPHDHPHHYHPQAYLPENLAGTRFYEYADNQREQHSKKFMHWLKKRH
ncbi:replication-associated recombination protein A [Psychrobacter aestuarii]|uniref:Replication-associated recombination protein A n=1 Tax=Psychrobacter aestuarii TaxID=556327 RepID=A0ABN0W2K4_9GAMM|nr:replication-associated recombination protein A [Psychrobacter aestuarii]